MTAAPGEAAPPPPGRLPLPVRNRIAELVLAALYDHDARDALAELAAGPEGDDAAARARRAHAAIAGRPLDPVPAPLRVALAQAAVLFDAGLYFEVHEILEPHWSGAAGPERQTLQGLIQVAVGLQHLRNGNLAGACSLLHDGAAKILASQRAGTAPHAFARAIAAVLDDVIALPDTAAARFDWARVPRFPRASAT